MMGGSWLCLRLKDNLEASQAGLQLRDDLGSWGASGLQAQTRSNRRLCRTAALELHLRQRNLLLREALILHQLEVEEAMAREREWVQRR